MTFKFNTVCYLLVRTRQEYSTWVSRHRLRRGCIQTLKSMVLLILGMSCGNAKFLYPSSRKRETLSAYRVVAFNDAQPNSM
ncbi:hypothetical protein J6590_103569, partial [Homalodisca vitripennis]